MCTIVDSPKNKTQRTISSKNRLSSLKACGLLLFLMYVNLIGLINVILKQNYIGFLHSNEASRRKNDKNKRIINLSAVIFEKKSMPI